MGLKQVWSCFVFPREFSSLFRASRVQLGSFGCSRVETWDGCVTSGKLSSQSLTSWLRYGFGTALDPLRWLVWLWESSGPASRSALRAFERAEFRRSARELQEGREEESAPLARHLFNCPVWTPPTGGWSNQMSVWGGAHPCPWLSCKAFSCERITFTHVFKLLSSLHIYTITTFVIVLLYEILQPFIKV